jgi:hypothetical protein
MDLKEMIWDFVDWIDLAQDRYQCKALMDAIMNFLIS